MNKSVKRKPPSKKKKYRNKYYLLESAIERLDKKKTIRFMMAFAWTLFGLISGIVGMGLVLYFAQISLPFDILIGEVASCSTIFSSVSVIWTLMLRKRDLDDGATKTGALCAIVMLLIGSGLVVNEAVPELSQIYDLAHYDDICLMVGVLSLLIASAYSGIVDGMDK